MINHEGQRKSEGEQRGRRKKEESTEAKTRGERAKKEEKEEREQQGERERRAESKTTHTSVL